MNEVKSEISLSDKSVKEIDQIILERCHEIESEHDGIDHDVALAQATEEIVKKLSEEFRAV
ncbi:hypothetical protein EVB32_028 [Rhizobium phage RHph_TM39]|uniref:Uncharacterized protein n=2 Tax=Cuauhnahuacvirus TaxID=3044696 RepID=A0A7S5RBS6_9CAUD|nr:hypothetical protein PQC16_gp028 [Rhizobium phage RHph_TM30]YP_010671177.1 hypothetical protein PQC17_gp028 [Rhizobium phage RHph_Y65]QIG71499.1 hypothetical protein EVB94_028 [Rhizobium phage RHph_TM40]QIG71862.1 hypothetical protein EVB95_028 [Rhizobium phage RHph_TM2_3B]QIG72224.1 hypothetical protein EVB96_028 [Rhizobium phage RHph_TM3_3_6]QIG77016.1 hypothetical protein EVB32_028 [Rhizobium phage RHph_TM39]QIG77356.1 hypothetical protein EVB61_028 [Rhizobium phage RHph_TM21B]QIG77615